MPSISKLKNVKIKQPPKAAEPLWTGPNGVGPNGGVTQGLLGRFLSCRERFRVRYVLGLKPADRFEPRMEFGNMWHVCEEALAGGDPYPQTDAPLMRYCQELCKRYPMQREQIDHWYGVAKALFPLYVEHWAKHPDVKDRTPLVQEQSFDVPYQLPSGRRVRLRGKWDSVDLIGKGKTAGIYLQENKTKSSIDGAAIARQLTFDLQTMLYLIALEKELSESTGQTWKTMSTKFPQGAGGVYCQVWVRYNVIRRSTHKTVESMLKKVEDDRKAGRIGEWFARWKVEITAQDIARFRRGCLDPVLEQLCTWYQWVVDALEEGSDPFEVYIDMDQDEDANVRAVEAIHFRYPYGIYNPLEEGGSGDVDAFFEGGSTVGLERAEVVFPELS